jgi:hypothetical protein
MRMLFQEMSVRPNQREAYFNETARISRMAWRGPDFCAQGPAACALPDFLQEKVEL